MRCPKCYGKIDKESNICTKCFLNINKIKENSSNKKAKELKRSGDGDLVVNSKILPKDLNKKTLALWCGFLGIFGGHYFYIGKMLRGILNLVISLFTLVMFSLEQAGILATGILLDFYNIFGCGFALVLLFTVSDFINILLNRFKVPVYIEEK